MEMMGFETAVGGYSIEDDFVFEYKEEPHDNDLKTFLESTFDGRLILMTYERYNKLTCESRTCLADILIAHELQKDINRGLNIEIVSMLTMKIVNTFPTEEYGYWITNMIYPDKILFDGKLIRRYNTWVEVTKCVGFATDKITSELDDGENAVVEVSLAYLKHFATPFSTIENLWLKTIKRRHEDVATSKVPICDYFQQFQCLQDPLGYNLLEKDFEFLYPASVHNLFVKWHRLSVFFENELKKKDKNFLKGSFSAAKRIMSILMHLSQIFPVTARAKTDLGPSSCPSKAESQSSFLLIIQSLQELQPVLARRSEKLKKYGLSLQPLPVIIGSSENFEKCFTILDTVIYEVENPLKALDLIFKIFCAFHMQYPPECEQIWTFLQRAVYDICTDNDKIHAETYELIIKYTNFQQDECIERHLY